MRNLKKALALVLALMMALSLMVTASASDYADGAKITKTEAVEVMSVINVFQGDNTGNFDPAGNLTRAQAAKIISYMKLGEAVAEVLPKDEAPFPDVKADRWYTGYVTYAKAEGIISGRTDGNFDPNATLTGYEFGKMVLEAAGISGEYTGSSWALNVSTALRKGNPSKIDLMAGVDTVLSQPISRENACQMAFNALNYPPDGEVTEYVVKASEADDATVLYRGTNAIEAYVIKSANEDSVMSNITTRPGSLGETVFHLKVDTSAIDTFGAPAVKWTAGDDEVIVADAAAKSYEETTGKTIKADLKMKDKDVTAVVVTDGKAADSVTLGDKDAFGGNGAQVDVYKTNDTSVKIVVVNTYVATIKSHTEAKDEAKEKITLTLDADKKPAATTPGTDFETDKFTDDDKDAVVLYTAKVAADGATSAIVDVTVPAEVKGTVTRYNNDSQTFVVDGATYKFSDKKHSTKVVSADNVGDEMALYLDNKGNVIYATTIGETAPDTAYAVVIDHASTGGWASNTGWSVKLLLADGSIVEKSVAKVTNEDSDEALTLDKDLFTGLVGKIVSYSESNDAVTMAKTTDAGTGITQVKRNTPTLAGSLVANNKTVFLVGSKDGKTLTVYTGINTVPNIKKLDKDGTNFVAVADDKNVATLVYIAKSEPIPGVSTSTDVIYVVGDGDTAKDIDKGVYTTYTAIINGEVGELYATTTAKYVYTDGDNQKVEVALNGNAVLLSGVTKDEKDLVTEGAKMTGDNVISADSNAAPANGIIKIGDESYSYDDNTVVYLIGDEISTVAMSAVEANESGVQIDGYTKDGVIAELFILTVAAE